MLTDPAVFATVEGMVYSQSWMQSSAMRSA
jgi:hypothetical protein